MYSFQLQFNTGGYAAVIPATHIEMDGGFIEGTKIWRETISEFKILRKDNATIYDQLESWFSDDTKFETRIYIKILKDSVEESIHWFGIKWGTINEYQKTFTVQPIVYDFWGQYFEAIKGVNADIFTGTSNSYEYYNTTTNFPYVANVTSEKILEDTIKHYLTDVGGWTDTNIVSSFMWQDDYEDTSAVGTYRGMPLDYVTGVQSFLKESGIITLTGRSVNDVIAWTDLFRALIYFDSNDKLRIEHIKFFNDKLTNNAVDFSANIQEYDDEWNYETVSIPTLEKVALATESDDNDSDFRETDIIYNDVRNRIDAQDRSFRSDLKTNLGYVGTTINSDLSFFSALKNHIYKMSDSSMLTFSSDFNYIDVSWNSGSFANSNDFYASGNQSYDFVADFSGSFSGEYDVEIRDRSASLISNTITINTATHSGTLTLTTGGTPTEDAYFRITGSSIGGSAQGWMTLKPQGSIYRVVIPTIDGVNSGSPKSNGAFSTANIIDSWWKDDRPSRDATINGSAYTFDGTQYNLRRKTVRFNLNSVINPLYGFNDGTRIAQIEKWTRNLKTGFYQIDLTYQEDD